MNLLKAWRGRESASLKIIGPRLNSSDKKIMEIKYEEASYYGQVRQNASGEYVRHGIGAIYYLSGRQYEGEWINGIRHGKGIEIFENGNIYDGEYFKGKAQGKGVYKWKNGEKYSGHWREGLREGKGNNPIEIVTLMAFYSCYSF